MKPSGAPRTLDVYEIAYLAGGPDRMVDTALVALVQTGRVRVHRPGLLATVTLSRRHPVEAAVLDAVGPIGHRSVDTIRWRLATDERLLEVGRRLQCEGLLGHTHRLVPHLSGGRSSPAPTHEGRRVLRGLETELPADVVAAGTDAMLVAICGTERMPDRTLRAAIFEEARTASHFGRGSHSTNREEAAAEAALAAQQRHGVIHGHGDPLFAPGGGTAPRLPSNRRGRR
jgi:hypothetical protein